MKQPTIILPAVTALARRAVTRQPTALAGAMLLVLTLSACGSEGCSTGCFPAYAYVATPGGYVATPGHANVAFPGALTTYSIATSTSGLTALGGPANVPRRGAIRLARYRSGGDRSFQPVPLFA